MIDNYYLTTNKGCRDGRLQERACTHPHTHTHPLFTFIVHLPNPWLNHSFISLTCKLPDSLPISISRPSSFFSRELKVEGAFFPYFFALGQCPWRVEIQGRHGSLSILPRQTHWLAFHHNLYLYLLGDVNTNTNGTKFGSIYWLNLFVKKYNDNNTHAHTVKNHYYCHEVVILNT